MQTYEPDFWLAFESEGELVGVASTDLAVDSADDPDIRFLLGVARGFHEAHSDRHLIFTSELTRWLTSVGLDWTLLDINVERVLGTVNRRCGIRLQSRSPAPCPLGSASSPH